MIVPPGFTGCRFLLLLPIEERKRICTSSKSFKTPFSKPNDDDVFWVVVVEEEEEEGFVAVFVVVCSVWSYLYSYATAFALKGDVGGINPD